MTRDRIYALFYFTNSMDNRITVVLVSGSHVGSITIMYMNAYENIHCPDNPRRKSVAFEIY